MNLELPEGKRLIIQMFLNKGYPPSVALKKAEEKHPDLFQEVKPEKKSKYNNKKVMVDGINFDSQKEADYYCELKLQKRVGELKWFLCQVPIICNEGDDTTKPIRYYADFLVCRRDGALEFIDVKASKTFQTEVYKLKKKLVKSQWGIEIEEVY